MGTGDDLDVLGGSGGAEIDRGGPDGAAVPDAVPVANADAVPDAVPVANADPTGSGPARRSGGRGRASGKSAKAKGRKNGQSGEPVRLRVDQAKRVSGAPPAAPKVATGPAGDVQSATMSATLLLTMAEQLMVGTIGPDAAFSAVERGLIVPPAGRMLARMDADALAKYSAIADPIMLMVGLGIWGFRVWTSVQARGTADRAPTDRGVESAAAASPSGPVVVSTAPPPAERVEDRGQAVNGVAPMPAYLAAHVESGDLGGL